MSQPVLEYPAASLPASPGNPRGARITLEVLYWLATAAVIFVLPWWVPVRGPILSDSYTVGFNNTAALLGLALMLGVRWLRHLWRPAWMTLRKEIHEVVAGICQPPAQVHRGPRWASLVSATLWLVVIGGYWQSSPLAFVGEVDYFLRRLDLMVLGFRPYADFEFGYGPLLLEAPFRLFQVTSGVLPLDTCYVLTVALSALAGVALLHSIVVRLPLSPRWQMALIGWCFLSTANLTIGAMYTPLRFVFSLGAILWILAQMRRAGSSVSWPALGRILAISFGACLLAFSISAETGLNLSFALIAVAVVSVWSTHPRYLLLALAPPLAVAVMTALCGPAYFKLLSGFAQGGLSFPILPLPYIIALVVTAIGIIPVLAEFIFRSEPALRPTAAALTVCFGLGLPPALGRCDPGHVYINGLGLFLFSFAVCLVSARRSLHLGAVANAFISIGTLAGTIFVYAVPIVSAQHRMAQKFVEQADAFEAHEAAVREHLPPGAVQRATRWEKRLPWTNDFLALLEYDRVATPLQSIERVDRFLKATGRYVPEYFPDGVRTTITPQDVERKLQEVRANRYVLVPPQAMDVFKGPPPTDLRAFEAMITQLFVFPIHGLPVRHLAYDPAREMMAMLTREYQVVKKAPSFLILERKPGSGSKP